MPESARGLLFASLRNPIPKRKKRYPISPIQKKKAVTPAAAPATSPTLAAPPTPAPPPPILTPSQTPPVTGTANGDNTGTKVELQTSYLALIAGLMADYQPDDEFLLQAGTLTRDQLIAQFQKFVASAETTKSSYQVWRADVQAERVVEQTAAPLRAGVKSVLVGRFGKSGTQLTTYGFEPAKVPVKSPLVKTTAAVKAAATRTARGTRGSVQKKSITGNVTGVVITPVTTGAAVPVATAAAPASAANAASTSNGAGAPVASASPAATGGTPPHS